VHQLVGQRGDARRGVDEDLARGRVVEAEGAIPPGRIGHARLEKRREARRRRKDPDGHGAFRKEGEATIQEDDERVVRERSALRERRTRVGADQDEEAAFDAHGDVRPEERVGFGDPARTSAARSGLVGASGAGDAVEGASGA
jgi:hypothetical protein